MKAISSGLVESGARNLRFRRKDRETRAPQPDPSSQRQSCGSSSYQPATVAGVKARELPKTTAA